VTTDALVAGDLYTLTIFTGSTYTPGWCEAPGTSVWIDAIQLAKQINPPTPNPYYYNTSAEEISLYMRSGSPAVDSWTNVFTEDEASTISAAAQVYQSDALRGSGKLHWKLYSRSTGDDQVLAGDSIAVIFLNSFQEHAIYPPVSRPGVYKLIVDYVDKYDRRADRQEMTFAVVRNPAELAPGTYGNFGVHMGMAVPLPRSGLDPYETAVNVGGRYSLDQGYGLVTKLGYHRERIFGAFDYGTICNDPQCATEYDYPFYPPEATEHDVRLTPVLSSTPPGWDSTSTGWGYYEDFVERIVDRYGPNSSDRIVDWIVRNESNNGQSPRVGTVAKYILHAAPYIREYGRLHHTLCSCNNMPWYLESLLRKTLAGDSVRVADVLDGIGINQYVDYSPSDHAFIAPETAASGWCVPGGTAWDYVPRSVRSEVVARSVVENCPGAVTDQYSLTETGLDAGSLLADRASIMDYWDDSRRLTLDTDMSGSLDKGRDSAEKFIRHELLWLNEGAGPIYVFMALTFPIIAWNSQFGLQEYDGRPAAPAAAQAQLNRELGTATLVRKVPAGNLYGHYLSGGSPCRLEISSGPVTPFVSLFQDGDDFVLVGWTKSGQWDACFTIDPQAYTITARGMEGEPLTIDEQTGYFVTTLTSSPKYFRISGNGLTAAGLTRMIDLRLPLAPSWDDAGTLGPWWADGDTLWADFTANNPGDYKEVRFSYRVAGSGSYSTITQKIWSDPTQHDLFHFAAQESTLYEAFAQVVEMTTDSLGTASPMDTLEDTNPRGPEEPPVVQFRDQLLSSGPNPTRDTVLMRGTVSRAGALRLDVYDVAGRCVQSLEENTSAAGIYLVRLRRDAVELANQRVVVLR